MRIYDGRTAFYQWDTNQKIVCNTLEVGDEVHFFNMRQPTALPTVAYKLDGKIVADVPNILLQHALPLTVYRTVENEFGFSTREEFIFNVNQRAKPDDYIYTETEVLSYNSLDKRITDLENSDGGEIDPAEIERIVEEYTADGIDLTDRTTGKHYTVYVDNGKLAMEESED